MNECCKNEVKIATHDALITVADMCEQMALYTGIDCADAIRALLEHDAPSALQQSPTPKLWHLVPSEPTEEMIKAAIPVIAKYKSINDVYKVMLSAAPSAPNKGE